MFDLLQQALTFRTVKSLASSCYESDDIRSVAKRSNYRKSKKRASSYPIFADHSEMLPEQVKRASSMVEKSTGFPEPFCEDRNTTLRHPDADTSPNATIEAEDFDLERKHSRSSFFHRSKHSNHGLMKMAQHESFMENMYDNITYAEDHAYTNHTDFAYTDRPEEHTTKEEKTSEKGDLLKPPKSRNSSPTGGNDGKLRKGVLRKVTLSKT